MKGYISNIIARAKEEKFGFIVGDDGRNYFFDKTALANGLCFDECQVRDVVEFELAPSATGEGMRKAVGVVRRGSSINTQVVEEPENIFDSGSIIDFFKPGHPSHLDLEEARARFLKNDLELITIKQLEKVLHISRVGHHFYDSRAKYEFCLAGATEEIRQFVRGRVEFLIVMSYFESRDWQQKTLNVEREIRKRREIVDRRPLPNFYILISNASELFDAVEKVKGGTNSAVIPFSFDEICGCTTKRELSDLLVSRFQGYLYENNMLGDTNAIDDDNLLFGDRGKIADRIVDRCQKKKSSGIFGLRRSGKSSVLNAVLRRLSKIGIKYIKIESRSELSTLDSWKTALYDVAKRVRESCLGIEQSEDESRKEYEQRLRLNSTESDYQKRPSACFKEDIQLYCRNEEVFVIAIDEIELITFNTATSMAWKSLEAYCGFWGALRDCGCSLVVSGVNSTINEMNVLSFNGEEGDNPMYQRIVPCADFSETYLPTFTDEQTRYMINTLGGYSNIAFSNVYSRINHSFGGQPYAVRQFCSYVFEKVKSQRKTNQIYEVSSATVNNLLHEFQESSVGNNLCELILQNLKIFAEEYEMLKELAVSPEKNRKIGVEDIAKIDHLQKYGLIDYDSGTGDVAFRLNSIYKYLRDHGVKNPLDMNNDERISYVNKSIRTIEQGLKTYLLRYFANNVNGEVECRRIMAKKGIKPKKGVVVDPQKCDIRDFFNHDIFIMFFSDLKGLIVDNWKLFGRNFNAVSINKNEFALYMDHLNIGRTDADHHDAEGASTKIGISDPEIKKFEVARGFLQKFIDNIV